MSVIDDVPTDIELTTLSPTGSAMAFIRGNELWVADFETRQVRQLTHTSSEYVRNGKADWVYFEEVYSRSWQAYRWSPDGTQLVYQQFDDSGVPRFRISDHTTVTQDFETEFYPKAGEQNPKVRLGVVAVAGGETLWIDSTAYPDDDLIIAHLNWMPDSSGIYCYAQNRTQTWLDILTPPLKGGKTRRLLRDTTAAWVDNPLDITFLSCGDFLFFSERNGWRHLYQVSPDGGTIEALTRGGWEVRTRHAVDADETGVVVSGTEDSYIGANVDRV